MINRHYTHWSGRGREGLYFQQPARLRLPVSACPHPRIQLMDRRRRVCGGLLCIPQLLKFVDRIPLVLISGLRVCPDDARAGVAEHLCDEQGRYASTHQATCVRVAKIIKDESRELCISECLFPSLANVFQWLGWNAHVGEYKPGELWPEQLPPTQKLGLAPGRQRNISDPCARFRFANSNSIVGKVDGFPQERESASMWDRIPVSRIRTTSIRM